MKWIAFLVVLLLGSALVAVVMERNATAQRERTETLDKFANTHCKFDGQELDGPYGIRMVCHAKLKSHS